MTFSRRLKAKRFQLLFFLFIYFFTVSGAETLAFSTARLLSRFPGFLSLFFFFCWGSGAWIHFWSVLDGRRLFSMCVGGGEAGLWKLPQPTPRSGWRSRSKLAVVLLSALETPGSTQASSNPLACNQQVPAALPVPARPSAGVSASRFDHPSCRSTALNSAFIVFLPLWLVLVFPH